MKRWLRTPLDRYCGRCGGAIPTGAPILELSIASVGHVLFRCEACEGPAPADLAPLAERAPAVAVPLTRFTPGMLPLDWKSQASREPGEDG
jgi:hypothetical protein